MFPSATIGSFTFGTYEFFYVGAAIVVLVGSAVPETNHMGQAALAVGRTPGGQIGGIHVDRTYLQSSAFPSP
jgi:hypothetical protein